MDSRLIVERTLPNGKKSLVCPFHFCIKGLQNSTLCRDEEDYDAFVKYIFLTAQKCNVLVVIYVVVSNHAHAALLAERKEDVDKYGVELKRVEAMWLNRKYGIYQILHGIEVSITQIDTVKYARNVFAYIPKNALDNGCKDILSYRWGGCRAMFSLKNHNDCKTIKVYELSTRAVEKIMHTGANLSGSRWLLDERMELDPGSACDCKYLEDIFNNDQSFFLRMIGSADDSVIRFNQMAITARLSDADFTKAADSYSIQWYGVPFQELAPERKVRFLKFLGTKLHLSIPQVARCFMMERSLIREILEKK